MDYSWLLDAPAGKHGFVKERGGHLYFADGTRARFLGFNMATRSATPTHEAADRLAERFATMGVNIIRLHAADAPIGQEPCSWSQTKEAPLLDYEKGTTTEFNKKGLDRFDYFAAKLKEKGIYLHIDLMVARRMLPGDGLDYPGSFQECVKLFPMINERLIELQMEYAKKLLTHVNPYTGLALADDPAVVVVQMNNEESAIKGTGEVQSNPELAPYEEEVVRKFNHFLLNKYGTRENLKKAWTVMAYVLWERMRIRFKIRFAGCREALSSQSTIPMGTGKEMTGCPHRQDMQILWNLALRITAGSTEDSKIS